MLGAAVSEVEGLTLVLTLTQTARWRVEAAVRVVCEVEDRGSEV